MKKINAFFRYLGYFSLSLLLGYIANLGGDDTDFVLKISTNLIPLLITILAFYITIFALILQNLVAFQKKNEANISIVFSSLKRDFSIELILIVLTFFCHTARGAILNTLSSDWHKIVTVITESISIFAFLYFLLAIYDAIIGLLKLLKENYK